MRLGECNGCGACCKHLLLAVHPVYLEPDKRRWLELHGIKLHVAGGNAWATIDATCEHLTEDNRCGIFGQPERPQVCAEWPFQQEDIDLVNVWAGEPVCSYSFSPEGVD
jgi:Fe-S-cluster containining protein